MIRTPRRGLSSLKTRGTGVGPHCESTSRHALYIKLAMLEIERERRAKEQVASAARAARLQQRMDQIETEVVDLTKLLPPSAGGLPAPLPAAPADDTQQAIPRMMSRVFRF